MNGDYLVETFLPLGMRMQGSEVEDGDVKKVAQAFCLVQVVDVVVVAGRRRQPQ